MTPKHTELAFEDAIQHSLVTDGGWLSRPASTFDRDRGLSTADVLGFIQDSQEELWAALKAQHGAAFESSLLETLTKSIDSQGTLEVLRHGFKFFGKKVACAAFKPAHGLNPEILASYAHNRLTLTRQVHFAPPGSADAAQSVDLVLSLNGFPVATAELKNPLTQQNVQHAIAQYRARDPKHRLFQFRKRALVHFAVDPDLAFMTTELKGEDTRFLPFNRGAGQGAGNPEHPSGHRTAYLWEEVWQRDSFIDLVGRFIHLMKDEKSGKHVMVFPRYHQLDSVRRLESAARVDGPGTSYLIQHSAGSGKSNSIGWLAHRLSTLHDAKDDKVFDSVVVITDRRVLDRQLQDTIYQFEHAQGVVAKIDEHSDQLAAALTSKTPIIITTLQKFPFVTEKVSKLAKRRYAVIVDEAHSSQTGESSTQMKVALADGEEEPADAEAMLEQVMKARGKQKNLSFFAFTATPKAKTLEVFGRRGADGKPEPFHLYSMRQAIEEGFILDVLKNYTTYKTYYRLMKAIDDDPTIPKKEASRQLARFASLHSHNLEQKTEVIIEHFRNKVRHRIGGKAKAMVVTGSRLHAVRYKLTFDKYLAEKGYADIRALVAFSGTVKDPDVADAEYTEPGMNKDKNGKSISEAGLPKAFESDEFQILLVANKYQTGFDQPLLHTMYVDKKLSNVQAVQTLSRLNRTCGGKLETFVLDFVNEAKSIEDSFQPFYTRTAVAESADPHQLYELAAKLRAAQVFLDAEVNGLCEAFYAPTKKKKDPSVHGALYGFLAPGLGRFVALGKENIEEQEAFRSTLAAFVRLYAFLAQVMPFTDVDLEKLYTFARFFELRLPELSTKTVLDLDGDVKLSYYRLDKVREGSIALQVGEPGLVYGPTQVGTGQSHEEKVKLSEIIDVVNDRFGTQFDEADQVLFDQFVAEAQLDAQVVKQAKNNALDNFSLGMKGKIEDLMAERMGKNQALVDRYLDEPEFRDTVFPLLVRQIYEKVRAAG